MCYKSAIKKKHLVTHQSSQTIPEISNTQVKEKTVKNEPFSNENF